MNKIISIIISIITLILGIIATYMMMLKLTNHSPTLAEMNFAMTTIMLGIIIKIKFDMGKFTEFSGRTKEDLKDLKLDVKEIKNTMNERFQEVNNRLIIIEHKI